VSLVYGLTGHDGMCRPLGYQVFVFVEGQFAGTLSPAPMDSRTDGALENIVWTASADGTVELSALFNRSSEGDPLCCPSRTSFVHYRIDRSGQTPVVVPVSSTTLSTGPSAPTPTSTGTAGPG